MDYYSLLYIHLRLVSRPPQYPLPHRFKAKGNKLRNL